MTKILYLTYDGLLDPLGRSQVLPYLLSLSTQRGYKFTILSFEKIDRYTEAGSVLAADLKLQGIDWHPLRFSSYGGPLAKFVDLFKFHLFCFYLVIRKKYQVIHARSHVPAHVGMNALRFTRGTRLVFDFRGFWVDERVDKGHWNLSKLSHHIQYRFYKRVEMRLFSGAAHVVVLTEKARRLLVDDFKVLYEAITVIPCCADYNFFSTSSNIKPVQESKNIRPPGWVLGYLGSHGRMYLSERYFRFVEICADIYGTKRISGRVVSTHRESLLEELRACLPERLWSLFSFYSADRFSVAKEIQGFSAMVSFIRPTWAKLASSPTKVGESFASGIPVIQNSGIGDLDLDIVLFNAGIILESTTDEHLFQGAKALEKVLKIDRLGLVQRTRVKYSLEVAVESYTSVYKHVVCPKILAHN